MKFSDAVFGLLLLALGLTVVAVVSSYPTIPAQRVGPSLFPALIAIGLSVAGLMLIVRGWRDRRTTGARWARLDSWVHSPRHVAGALGVVGSVAFYIVAVNWLGFFLTALIILVVLFRLFGVALGRSILIAVIATFVIHFAFYKLLRVPLPWGLFTQFAW
ncbi:MAG: tripartite tricarboxylate transporter TctB family protein [Burkholderiaceae bacterium]|nr:tripartite tricarboxylate transporter TctB family protein [Burkholderiaceae bacterium]